MRPRDLPEAAQVLLPIIREVYTTCRGGEHLVPASGGFPPGTRYFYSTPEFSDLLVNALSDYRKESEGRVLLHRTQLIQLIIEKLNGARESLDRLPGLNIFYQDDATAAPSPTLWDSRQFLFLFWDDAFQHIGGVVLHPDGEGRMFTSSLEDFLKEQESNKDYARELVPYMWATVIENLLEQDGITEVETVVHEPKSRTAKRHAVKHPPQPVHVVRLRRRLAQQMASVADAKRDYQHRWIVRGHWRNQAHGPGMKQHRRIYVAPYVKGPDGAPLLKQERVYVV